MFDFHDAFNIDVIVDECLHILSKICFSFGLVDTIH
uniref:Uncharacterized protein n=1 Tax=Lepeophtheirus salmonis TaxID=72036 RepID=A0A0K2T2L9_LEPSM